MANSILKAIPILDLEQIENDSQLDDFWVPGSIDNENIPDYEKTRKVKLSEILEKSKDYTDTRLDQPALSDVSIDNDSSTKRLRLNETSKNLSTGATATTRTNIPNATASLDGAMPKEKFQQVDTNKDNIAGLQSALSDETTAREDEDAELLSLIQDNAARISELQGRGGALPHNDFGQFSTPLTAAQQQTLTTYAISCIWPGYTNLSYNSSNPAASTFKDAAGNDHTAAEIFNSTWVRNDFDNHRFVLTNTQDTAPKVFTWADVGVDTVGIATDSLAGIVKGKTDIPANNGSVNVLPDGTMKVIGFNADMSAFLNFDLSKQTLTSVSNVPTTAANSDISLSASATLSFSDLTKLKTGYKMRMRIRNAATSAITLTLPSSGSIENDYGASTKLGAGEKIELEIWCYADGKYRLRKYNRAYIMSVDQVFIQFAKE